MECDGIGKCEKKMFTRKCVSFRMVMEIELLEFKNKKNIFNGKGKGKAIPLQA